MVDCQVRHSQLCKIIQTQDIYVQTSAVNSIRGWLVRMSKNLWVPDRCWPRICTSIAPISLRRSSENYISPSGKYLTLRGNFISHPICILIYYSSDTNRLLMLYILQRIQSLVYIPDEVQKYRYRQFLNF